VLDILLKVEVLFTPGGSGALFNEPAGLWCDFAFWSSGHWEVAWSECSVGLTGVKELD